MPHGHRKPTIFFKYIDIPYFSLFFSTNSLIHTGHAYSIDTTSRTVACATVVAPLHHLGVRALRSQYPSYTGAVRLLTAWAAQHYYSGKCYV